jgi:hypothetical protein
MTFNDLPDPNQTENEANELFPTNLKIILVVVGLLVVLVVAGLLLFPKTRAASTSASVTQTVAEVAQTVLPTVSIQTSVVRSGPALCEPASLIPTPNATEVSLYPPVSDSDWVQGDQSAEITFIEYSDFQ